MARRGNQPLDESSSKVLSIVVVKEETVHTLGKGNKTVLRTAKITEVLKRVG